MHTKADLLPMILDLTIPPTLAPYRDTHPLTCAKDTSQNQTSELSGFVIRHPQPNTLTTAQLFQKKVSRRMTMCSEGIQPIAQWNLTEPLLRTFHWTCPLEAASAAHQQQMDSQWPFQTGEIQPFPPHPLNQVQRDLNIRLFNHTRAVSQALAPNPTCVKCAKEHLPEVTCSPAT